MLGDGFAFSIMVGAGESYFAPFALALGFGDVAAGLVATLPMLCGSLLQLVTPAAVGHLASHKRWVVICAAFQAATFVPLAAGALAGSMSPVTLYVAVSLYWAFGMATSPAWNTWAGTLVPERIRAGYFARRSRWSQVALLGGLALGALLLQRGDAREGMLGAYALAFAVALLARSASTVFLSRQSEARPAPIGDTRISLSAISEHIRRDGHGRLLAYLLTFQVSVWIAAPYFTPYMLGPLGLDYTEFALLTGAAFLARIAVLPALGRVAHAAGTRRLLWIGSIGIVPLPILWLVSNSLLWLLALQLFAGIVWAAFELATLLSFFEHIPLRSRTSVLSAYNVVSAAAISGGSLLGAAVVWGLGDSTAAYSVILVLSSLARLASLGLLRGTRDVIPTGALPIPLRTLSLRPSAGALQRPVLAGLSEEAVETTPTERPSGQRASP
jgi:MFS family permease